MNAMMNRKTGRRRALLYPVAACCLLLMGTGCTVGPDYETPDLEVVPDAWQNAAAADLADSSSTLEQWWTAFGDTLLDSLIVMARETSPDAAAAVGRIREARAYHQIAGGLYYPQIGLEGGYNWSEVGENTALGAIVAEENNPGGNWEFGLGASWELDVFGRIRREREATGALVQASIEDYRDVLVSLQAEVASAYVSIRTLLLRLEYARNNVESQRGTLDIVLAREDAGLVPLQDVTRARSNLANTEASIPQFESELEVARNTLAILLGLTPGSLDERLGLTPRIPDPSTVIAVDIPAELLRRRPDVRRSERELAAQTAQIGVATADLYPSFSLSGVLSVQGVNFSDLGDAGNLGWSLFPGVQWNLFSGGRIRGRIKVEEAQTEQRLAAYEKTVLRALAEVENTMVALRQEELRRGLLLTAVEASQQSVELVHTQYISGLIDFQSYLDTQRTLFDQQDQYAVSQGRVVGNLIELNRALGGGWSLDDPDPDIRAEGQTMAAKGDPSTESSVQPEEVD